MSFGFWENCSVFKSEKNKHFHLFDFWKERMTQIEILHPSALDAGFLPIFVSAFLNVFQKSSWLLNVSSFSLKLQSQKDTEVQTTDLSFKTI